MGQKRKQAHAVLGMSLLVNYMIVLFSTSPSLQEQYSSDRQRKKE
jgi:hypothetical protein